MVRFSFLSGRRSRCCSRDSSPANPRSLSLQLLRSLAQERDHLNGEVDLPPQGVAEIDLTMGVPLKSIQRFKVAPESLRHLILGMLASLSTQVFVRPSVNCELRDFRSELLLIPLRFPMARIRFKEFLKNELKWSNPMALKTLRVKPSEFFPMSVLAWNCRGAAHPDFMKNICDLATQHKPMLIYILETRLPFSRIDNLKKKLKLYEVHGVDSNGLSGGIWMFWDSRRISVDILPHSHQAIHALVREAHVPDSSSKDGTCFS